MPKLDATHTLERLTNRLDELRSGVVVAKREVEALLTPEQVEAMNAAWAAQKAARVGKKPKTLAQQKAVGWKEIRDIRIEAYEAALVQAWERIEEEMEQLQAQAAVRAMRVYMEELNAARKEGATQKAAENLANNALTRAGLKRFDGKLVGTQGLTKRDKEIRAMEDAILKRAEIEMTDDEREQLELSREYDRAVEKNRKK